MPRRGHRPQRTCLGCGAKDDQDSLLRLVMDDSGELKADRLAEGRAGYLHEDGRCWQAFLKKKSHYRAFRREIGRAAKEKLIEELRERHWELKDGEDKGPPAGQRTGHRN